MNFEKILNQLRQIKANPAVSVFVSTHRTSPANEQDLILVKNALKQLEERLLEQHDKRVVAEILEHVNEQLATVDYHYNLDTLCIFATQEQAYIVKLPFNVEPRIVIDTTFAIRDIVQEVSSAVHYHALVIDKEKARLIEGFNAELIQEYSGQTAVEGQHFPLTNSGAHTTSGTDRSQAANDEHHLREFFHRVDHLLTLIQGRKHLPIVLIGDARNMAVFKELTTHAQQIVASVNNSSDLRAPAAKILQQAQDSLVQYHATLITLYKNHMGQAVGHGLFSTDLAAMYRHAVEGRIETLYVAPNYIVKGDIDAQTLQTTPNENGTVDDVIDEVVEAALNNASKVRFIAQSDILENAGIAAVLRF